jgi:hypothetical protein
LVILATGLRDTGSDGDECEHLLRRTRGRSYSVCAMNIGAQSSRARLLTGSNASTRAKFNRL